MHPLKIFSTFNEKENQPDLTEIREMTTTSEHRIPWGARHVFKLCVITTETIPMQSQLGSFVVVDTQNATQWSFLLFLVENIIS